MIDCESMGQLIREKRKENGLTQRELADFLNVTDKSISKWECGKCYPDISLWDPLFNILDISKENIDLMEKPIVDESFYKYTVVKKVVHVFFVIGIITLVLFASVLRDLFVKMRVIFWCSVVYFSALGVVLYFTNKNIKKSKVTN